MRSMPTLLAVSLMTLAFHCGAATLERVKDSGSFRLGYRTDARPFSYKSESGEPKGYAVDLCRRVAVEVKSALKLEEMEVKYSRYFTHEPYALALERGDSDFRLLVDRTLSDLYRSGDVEPVFLDAFGVNAEPTDVLKMMFLMNSLPR